jgi:hypothetical protein
MKIFIPVYGTGGHKKNKSALIGTGQTLLSMTARLRMLGAKHIEWKFFWDKKQIEFDQ